jgi:hypothetical protein
MKLPLPVKHLLTLRNPQTNPSPSIERLHGVFAPTLQEATRHKAQDGWLVLAVRLNQFMYLSQVTDILIDLHSPFGERAICRGTSVSLRLTPDAALRRCGSPHRRGENCTGRPYARSSGEICHLRRRAARMYPGLPGDDKADTVAPKTILSLEALTGALEDDVKKSLRQVSHR